MKIINIVGYKNSGKTTLCCEIIKRIKNQNILYIKHSHHMPDKMLITDTKKAIISGAKSAIFINDNLYYKIDGRNKKMMRLNKKTIYEILEESNHYDIIVIEGYKNLDFPKVVITDKKLKLKNIVFVVRSMDILKKNLILKIIKKLFS